MPKKVRKAAKKNVCDSGAVPLSKQRNGKGKRRGKTNKSQWGTEEDNNFRQSLEADGRYTIMEMAADGNCLFRSLSDQLFQDHGNDHGNVRNAVCDYIQRHEDYFSVFLVLDDDGNEEEEDAADFESYVSTMRQDGEWGGNLELVAAARLYCRNITVFSANLSALNICHGSKKSSGADLLLSYHDNDHYSSVRDATTKTKPLDKPPPNTNTPDRKVAKKLRSPKKGSACALSDEGSALLNESDKEKGEKMKRPIPAPKKKNALCPCGSGLKYKRCCYLGERRETRSRKAKGSEDSTVENDKSSDDTFEMNGNFRVLQI